MLELGLRLASKKPTVVLAAKGGIIPFDIRDFHVIQYPPDQNIIEMEEFFGLLERNLKAKYKSLQDGSIQPFLGSVVVDVATPETRAIPMNELILERLDDLAKRISRSENRTSHFMPARPRKAGDVLFRTNEEKSTAFYSVPTNSFDEVWGTIENDYSTLQVIGEDDGLVYIAASSTPSRSSESAKETALAAMVRTFGGSLGVPERYTKAYR